MSVPSSVAAAPDPAGPARPGLAFAATMARRTVASAFAANVARAPGAPALLLPAVGTTVSYAALDALSARVGNVLLGLGARPGRCVALVCENNLEHALVSLAGARVGVAVASLHWRLSPDELAHAVGVADPDLVLVSERFVAAAEPWLPGPAAAGRAVVIDDPGAPARPAAGASFWDLVGRASATLPAGPGPHPEDVVSIMATSGSTGRPKAAAVSHRALVARAMVMTAEMRFTRDEAFVAWAPMSHMTSSDYMFIQLVLGGPTAIIDGYDVGLIGDLLRRQPVGWIPIMPGSYGPLLEDVRAKGQPRALRAIGCMADMLTPEGIAEITTTVGAPFFNSFGSTEAGTVPVPNTLIPVGVVPTDVRKRQSSFVDVRLVDEGGRDVAIDEPGEMLLRGPTLFSGYWRDDEATATDVTADGWFRGGDVMVRHADGTLDYVDRRKYMIKSGGESIYPAEIERVLLAHDEVVEATVVRAPDERWGETPVAFVALREPGRVDAEALMRLCTDTLSRYKRPREIVLVAAEDLPRNVTGKIQRSDLERWARDGSGPAPDRRGAAADPGGGLR